MSGVMMLLGLGVLAMIVGTAVGRFRTEDRNGTH
jgi:hypothetical protein